MPLAEKPGAVNDAAHPQHEVTEANCESQSSKFADALALEISKAPVRHLDFFARQLWAGHANGILTDDQAQDLAEQLADRQRERGRPTPGPKNAPAAGPMARVARCRRVYPRSQDRQASIDRRRQLAPGPDLDQLHDETPAGGQWWPAAPSRMPVHGWRTGGFENHCRRRSPSWVLRQDNVRDRWPGRGVRAPCPACHPPG